LAAHQHSQSHSHSHAPADFGRAFAIGSCLNIAFVLIEAGYGIFANSMALLADAGHNLSDVLGLLIAWFAAGLAKRPPTERFSYGLGGSTILAALANAVFLLVACGAIAWEAVGRLFNPEPVIGGTVIAVAAIGIVINAFTAYLFAGGRKGDINIRGAYLHMAADALVSAGVVIAGIAMVTTGILWIDPLVSLLVVVVILWSTFGLLSESVGMSLGAVPRGIDIAEVEQHLLGLPGVDRVHDLHIWPISTTRAALTAHLVISGGNADDAFLIRCSKAIEAAFQIDHCTFQIERGDDCELEPAHVV
jgi:cobalt-zinc-cadmium efflux system protein